MYYRPELDFSPDEVLDYLRKSRSDDPLLTVEEVLEKHELQLDEWAEKNLGAKVPEENKHREVVSGETIDSRPELLRLLKRIESPKIKAILIVDCQRLGRPDLEDIGRLSKLFRYTNTLIITPTKTFDLRDEYDREQFERELMRGNEFLEYTKKIMNRGRLLAVQQGHFIGQKPPYGYEKDIVMEGKRKCHTLKIKEDEADVVRMIFNLYVNEDMGRVNIAHRLNDLAIPTRTGALWSQDTIKRMLTNDHYTGRVRWNFRTTVNIVEDGEIKKVRPQAKTGEYLLVEGKHPAIIDDELFKAAQEKCGRNHKAKPKTKVRNPLAGLVFCQCGRAMSLRTYKAHDGAPRLLCDNQTYCKTSSCLYSEILDRVKEILEEAIKDCELKIEDNHSDAAKSLENHIKRLKARLVELQKKELSQWEKYSEDGMPKEIFEKLNEKVLKEKDEVQQALCLAYASKPVEIDYEEVRHRFQNALDALNNPDMEPAKSNRLLKECIERIDYNRKKSVRLKKFPGEKKGERFTSTGGHWESFPIELNVKLKFMPEQETFGDVV